MVGLLRVVRPACGHIASDVRLAMVRSTLVLLMLGIVGVFPGAAVELEDLYFAQTVVTGTEEPERTRGFQAGLLEVIVKVTGDSRLVESEAVATLLEDAGRFVQQFEYEDRMKGIPVHDEQGTRDRPHFLRIRFRPAEVDGALDELGLSKWPADRPAVAVWLGVETANGRYVLHASGPEGYGQRAALIEASRRNGVPVILPEGEGPGSAIVFDAIAMDDLNRLKPFSEGAEALLVGVLSLAEGGYWDIEWNFRWQQQDRAWRMEGVSFDTALNRGVQDAALILSGKDAGASIGEPDGTHPRR